MPAFPGSILTNANVGVAVDQATSTLVIPCGPTDAILIVASGSVFVIDSIITADQERMLVTSISGNQLGVSRGFDNTTPTSHQANIPINVFVEAFNFNSLVAEVQAVESSLFSGGQVSMVGGVLTLGNYTLGIGASPRTIAHRLQDQVSVKDFKQTAGDGTDDTAAFQAAFAYLQSIGGGELFVGPGTYKLTAALTFSGGSLRITGCGSGVAIMRWDAAGGIHFTGGVATYQAVNTCTIKGITLLANCASCGDAINLAWTASGFNVADYGLQDDLRIVNNYQSGFYWSRGIVLTNASNYSIRKIWCGFSGINTTAAITINNSLTVAGFNYIFNELSVEGGLNGIVIQGWAEGISLTNSGFVQGGTCITADATGVSAGCTDILVANSTFNCGVSCIITTGWRGVFLANNDFFHVGPPSGDGNGAHVLCQGAGGSIVDFVATGNKFEEGNPGIYPTRNGITLVNCNQYSICSNILLNFTAGGGIALTANCSYGIVSNNLVSAYTGGGTQTGSGIFAAGSCTNLVVNGNLLFGWVHAINLGGSFGVVNGNILSSCTNGIITIGSSWDTRFNSFFTVTNPYEAGSTGRQELFGSGTINVGTIASLATAAYDITVTGALLGMFVEVAPPYDLQGVMKSAVVKIANTVTVSIFNPTVSSKTIGSGTWALRLSS